LWKEGKKKLKKKSILTEKETGGKRARGEIKMNKKKMRYRICVIGEIGIESG